MRALLRLFVVAVVLFPLTARAIDVWGDQWGTWTRDNSPYNVVGEIRVPPESTLVIEPGVVVDFQGHYKFIVDISATLLAVGTESDSIYFTTQYTAIGWHGIRFIHASGNSRVSYCRLDHGKATGSETERRGGAIYCWHSTPTISHNMIRDNSASSGGGINCWYSSPAISNNTISRNSASYQGGGIFCGWSNPRISNNTIYHNWAEFGGGVWCGISNPWITNTILWGNTAPTGSEIRGDAIVTYSDVRGGWEGEGNIDADPLFVDPEGGDFTLQWGSPCIDAGDPNSPRDPDGTRTDMGAFYFDQRLFSPQEFDFGLLIEGSSEKVLSLQNHFGDTILFSLSSDVRWISFLPDSGSILPDSSLDVTVTFDGSDLPLGPNEATILLEVVTSNGEYDHEIPVCVRIFSTEYTYISLIPDSWPIIIPPEGGSFSYWAQTHNASEFTYYFDIWIDATLPGGETYGPIYKRENFLFRPQQTIGYHITQNVPGYAPPGRYSYNFKMGVLPDQVDFQDSFTFRKLGSVSSLGRASVTSWDLVGWGEEFVTYLGQEQDQVALIPKEYSLSQNYPNPFNARTFIDYQLPAEGHVKLEVYNLLGRKVATLVNEAQEAGYSSVIWDASEVSSGIYFYKLSAGDFTETRRMMLVK